MILTSTEEKVESSRAPLKGSSRLALRLSIIVSKDGEHVNLISVGNLIREEAKVGVISCQISQIASAATQGFVQGTYNPAQ